MNGIASTPCDRLRFLPLFAALFLALFMRPCPALAGKIDLAAETQTFRALYKQLESFSETLPFLSVYEDDLANANWVDNLTEDAFITMAKTDGLVGVLTMYTLSDFNRLTHDQALFFLKERLDEFELHINLLRRTSRTIATSRATNKDVIEAYRDFIEILETLQVPIDDIMLKLHNM